MISLIDFEYSPWLLIVCLSLGMAYGYIQYQKKAPWSTRVNKILTIGRVLLVFFLAVLLLGPVIRLIRNLYQKPLIVFAIDDSESISLTSDSIALAQLISDLGSLKQELIDNDWEVQSTNLTGSNISLDSISFNGQRSDLTKMIKSVENEHSGANLKGIVMITDGIFNSGFSPDFISKFTPIYNVGTGDTVPKKDLSIINVRHNKTVYQGNQFPVEVSVRNEGLGPESVSLKLFMGNSLQESYQLPVVPENRLLTHTFNITANSSGKWRVSIVLDSIAGESTTINNNRSFYIDVIEGQQNILILADAPSPDVKALRLAIEQNEHFAVNVVIGDDLDSLSYDLIILVNTPTKHSISPAYKQIVESTVPLLILAGNEVNLGQLNRDGLLDIRQSGNQYDRVSAVQNTKFNEFTLSPDFADWVTSAPPVSVPFASITLEPSDLVLLYQRVGTVTTTRPIIYVTGSERKKGVIIGDGLWKWRLNEYLQYAETRRFDELIGKLVMYLAAKPDNRQFKLYPANDGYELGEGILFISETYNELFEPLFGEPITLKVSGQTFERDFSFTPQAGSQNLSIDELPEGLYSYTATTSLNGNGHQVSGQFVVDKPNIEAADLTADFFGLRKLSIASGGIFVRSGEINQLKDYFKDHQAPTVIHSREKELLILNLYWVLIALILLVSAEWLTRKMMGGY